MDHIALSRWADLILVEPATANTISKLAKGTSEDLASTVILAYDGLKIGIKMILKRIAPVTQVMYIPVSATMSVIHGSGFYEINSTHNYR